MEASLEPSSSVGGLGVSVQAASSVEGSPEMGVRLDDLSLDANGVCVQRGLCENEVCELCLAEILQGLDHMLALPGPMSKTTGRDFLPIATSRAPVKKAEHRRDFKLKFSSVESVLRAVLSGNAGAILVDALGRDAEICELSVIRSSPGAASQDWHSDSEWSATGPQLRTMFFALHGILEETMGPTRFCPNTHAPRYFPDERWIPPTPARVAERPSVWFALNAGDAVLMDSFTWHCGGANTSERPRTLLAVTFVERHGGAASGSLTLGDFA